MPPRILAPRRGTSVLRVFGALLAHFSFPAPSILPSCAPASRSSGASFSNRPRHIAHPAIFLATTVTAFVYWATGLATACSFALSGQLQADSAAVHWRRA
ncbi:hypothetical protein DFH08DRAFT_880673 [Mycena albidolilacea]|uniref:Uncharacterized protein n=1 Tax=Mycena albidolilacea TaxID=1033008 RepID=A0AAD7EM71_9AGAR|nr:hypothetical protein DFH08DRAFT_880673 [Mycena albidolilacea]